MRARRQGARVVRTSLEFLNAEQMRSAEAMLRALAQSLAEELDLALPHRADWDPDRGPNASFTRYVKRELLGGQQGPVVWALDEVDRLLTCEYGVDILAMFRFWHNERALNPSGPWTRLTIAIAYATEPHLFLTDENLSPFNVGTRLELQDFGVEQVGWLNERHGAPLPSEIEVERLHSFTGGHPYLTRRALHELVRQAVNLDQLEREAARGDGPFGDHLRRLLNDLGREPNLREALRSLLASRSGSDRTLTEEQFYRLRTAGILRGASEYDAQPRCRLYGAYLGKRLQAPDRR